MIYTYTSTHPHLTSIILCDIAVQNPFCQLLFTNITSYSLWTFRPFVCSRLSFNFFGLVLTTMYRACRLEEPSSGTGENGGRIFCIHSRRFSIRPISAIDFHLTSIHPVCRLLHSDVLATHVNTCPLLPSFIHFVLFTLHSFDQTPLSRSNERILNT